MTIEINPNIILCIFNVAFKILHQMDFKQLYIIIQERFNSTVYEIVNK